MAKLRQSKPPGCIFRNNGRLWWRGRLPGNDKRVARPGPDSHDYSDSFYLLPLAVFNPEDFRTYSNAELKQVSQLTNEEFSSDCQVVRSADRALYFDDKGRLRRICLYDVHSAKEYLRVDLMQYAERGDLD